MTPLLIALLLSADLGRFPLYQPWPEPRLFVCLDAVSAIAISRLDSEGRDTESRAQAIVSIGNGMCGTISAIVVYTKQVHKIERGGRLYTVYEGRVGKRQIFVPMVGYLHLDTAA